MRLDIVIPAHNEAHRIDRTLSAYRRYFIGGQVRFLVALDGCLDSTYSIVRRHSRDDPRVEAHIYPRIGKGGVIKRAFRAGEGDFVAFLDADGSTPPPELALLFDSARQRDGAIASRRHVSSTIVGHRATARRAISAVFAWLVGGLFRLPYTDTQCGAKVFRRSALEATLALVRTDGLLFDLELLLLAHHRGLDIVEIPTHWIHRPGSRVSPIRDTTRTIASLARLWVSFRLVPEVAREHRPTVPLEHRGHAA